MAHALSTINVQAGWLLISSTVSRIRQKPHSRPSARPAAKCSTNSARCSRHCGTAIRTRPGLRHRRSRR
ncbi:hypothetical protein [Williamsia sp.]|uniref:hypothetical protein n=1 Tax=Williamsia sp. TaxID=1872085 RepID=UPI0039C9FACD